MTLGGKVQAMKSSDLGQWWSKKYGSSGIKIVPDFDKLFKTGILVLGIILLCVFHSLSTNGRYQVVPWSSTMAVLDTRTGELFVGTPHYQWTADVPVYGLNWLRVNPVTLEHRKKVAEQIEKEIAQKKEEVEKTAAEKPGRK
jgi:hypothetical protein